jgi:hypothetical protein
MSGINEWKDVNVQKKKQSPKVCTELETDLVKLLVEDGSCIRCINRSCKNNKPHGEKFPDKISHFVQNPLHINGLAKLIQDANLDFNGKQPFFTICNYIMGNCKNCEEGRIKCVDFNDQYISLCHPPLDNDKDKITVGMHMNIKLIIKGKKYEVSPLPFEVIINRNKGGNLNIDTVSVKDEWPALDVDHKRKRIASPVMSFAHIKDSFKNSENIDKNNDITEKNNDYFIPIQDKDKNENKNMFNAKVADYIDDQIYRYKNRENDLLDEMDYIKHKYDDLLYEFNQLKTDNKNLSFENYELKNNLDELRRKSYFNQDSNNDIYNEIKYNIDNINNRVTNQFLESEYKIF